jgi:hypothetical protein
VKPAELIEARLAIGRKWCEEHGVEYPPTKMEDILAIRALPEWKTPDRDSTVPDDR